MTREDFLAQLPALVANYQPANDVLERIDKLCVLMLVGPSGVGKSTLINELPFKYVVVDNTRLPRPGEVEGIDFYFRSDYDQIVHEIKEGRFVQVAVDSGGDLKATRASAYPDEGNVSFAVVADVVPIFRKLGFAKTITAFVTPPSYSEWMRRLGQHRLEEDALRRRLVEAQRSLNFALNDSDTHFILSDQRAPALKQLRELVSGHIDTEREEQARAAAEDIFHNLNKNSYGKL